MAKNVDNKQQKSILNFPEKTNATSLFIIVVLSAIVVLVISILLFSNRKYIYIPEYEKMSYSEDINPGLIILSNYDYVENADSKVEELVKKNKTILTLAYADKENKEFTITNLNGNYVGVYNDEEYEHLSEYVVADSLPKSSARTHQFTTSVSGSKFDYKEIYGKLAYDYTDNKTNETTRKIIEYKNEMIELTKEDKEILKLNDLKDETTLNNFSENPKYFSSYSVYVNPNANQDSEINTIYAQIAIKESEIDAYVLDYQNFGVTENGEIYPLIGYYNISTNIKTSYSRSISVPKNITFKYLVAKAYFKCEVLNKETNEYETKEMVLYSKKLA